MTNHSETADSSENGDITGRDGFEVPMPDDHDSSYGDPYPGPDADADPYAGQHPYDTTAYVSHTTYDAGATYDGGAGAHQVTLRTPGELADALPYLLGYRPEDSIVLVSLSDRDGRGRFGGRARLGIPANPDDWPAVAEQLAEGLIKGSERRGARPERMVAYLCQDPTDSETGHQIMERLKPLAQHLRVACGSFEVPVIEALCISDGRFWSYCCARTGCCPVEGTAMGLPGTSVLAAAATYAGIQVRGTLRELRARLQPLETGIALEQEVALDAAGMELIPLIIEERTRASLGDRTMALAAEALRRFAEAPAADNTLTDRRDDDLLGCDEAATLILGLQDRVTRDRAAGWMEGDEAAPALRLWRALARRCVGPYYEHAAAPLTLAGWVAWSSGDELEAREALAMALGADPGYLFARLLHQACNEGLDPESVRRCLRAERKGPAERDGYTERERHEEPRHPAAAEAPGAETGTPESPEVKAAPAPAPVPGGRLRRPHARSARSTRPAPASPGGTRPRTSAKGPVRRRSERPEGVRREGPRPDSVRPEDMRGEGMRSDGARRYGARPEGVCPEEGVRSDALRPDAVRRADLRADGVRPEGDGSKGERPYG